MSASQLAQAMEDALEDMTEETYDEALISAYLDALDQKAPMPDMPDTNEAWSAFQKKVEDASLVVGGSSPKRPARFRRVVRTGLVAAIMVAVLFGVMVAAQAAGVDVFGAVARWTEETFQFHVTGDHTAAWFVDYREDLTAAGLSEKYLPAWVPDGYEVTDLQVDKLSGSTEVYILYSSENSEAFDLLISIYNEPDAMEQHIFEKDSTLVQTIQGGGKVIYLFENLGVQTAVCQNRNVTYSLVGDLSENLIEDIFTSIGDG